MTYFTTMNLPAPPYVRFKEIFEQYALTPAAAVPDFEVALKHFFEVEAVYTFSNCFTALSMALVYAARNRPKTVAIAGLAYRRTTDIVMWAGLRPIYVDNDLHTLCMSLRSLEARLKSGSVGCVLVQHPMVNICNPDEYISLCNEYSVPIIYDSVEATGGRFGNKRLGGFGIAEGFSLHPSKVINGAEGGFLTFAHMDNYLWFREYMVSIGLGREHGVGNSIFGLEPLHAMMGLASLEAYPRWRAMFKSHYLAYRELLAGSSHFRLVEYDMAREPNFKSILVELRTLTHGFREDLIRYLESHHIGVRPYYAPLHPMTKMELLPVANALSERYIFLPIGYSVSIRDIEFICDKLLTYAER